VKKKKYVFENLFWAQNKLATDEEPEVRLRIEN